MHRLPRPLFLVTVTLAVLALGCSGLSRLRPAPATPAPAPAPVAVATPKPAAVAAPRAAVAHPVIHTLSLAPFSTAHHSVTIWLSQVVPIGQPPAADDRNFGELMPLDSLSALLRLNIYRRSTFGLAGIR